MQVARGFRQAAVKLITRGNQWAFLDGGLYLRSEPETQAIRESGRVPHDIPGQAMVRFSVFQRRHPVKRDRPLSVLISGVGRAGNSIIQTMNSVAIANALETSSIRYHQFDLIDNRRVDLGAGVTLTRIKPWGRHIRPAPRILWKTRATKGDQLLLDPCSPQGMNVRAALSQVMFPDGPRGEEQVGTLTIHVRSGDIFSRNPHPGYGQPPLAFYTAVIQKIKPPQVLIVSEDHLNPVADALVSWCTEQGVVVKHHCLGLVDTMEQLFSAETIACGRGTFVPAIASLSPVAQNIYVFEPGNLQLLCDATISVYAVRDTHGEYREKILSQNWHNSEDQRALMLSYPETHLSEAEKLGADNNA